MESQGKDTSAQHNRRAEGGLETGLPVPARSPGTEPGCREGLGTEPPEPGTEQSFALLSDLSPGLRSHPLFRQGYNRGYSDRAYEELLSERMTGASPAAPPVTANTPAIFDVTAGGLRHRLAPGVRAMRDLGMLTAERLSTETPCCGRRITLASPEPDQTRTAMCCHCGILFAVSLAQEEPDGFGGQSPHVAVFAVEQLDVAIAQHRAGRWERRPGKPLQARTNRDLPGRDIGPTVETRGSLRHARVQGEAARNQSRCNSWQSASARSRWFRWSSAPDQRSFPPALR